eukprot:4540398-Amphidinium_carterae.1
MWDRYLEARQCDDIVKVQIVCCTETKRAWGPFWATPKRLTCRFANAKPRTERTKSMIQNDQTTGIEHIE